MPPRPEEAQWKMRLVSGETSRHLAGSATLPVMIFS